MLSSGVDSAILASFLPPGSFAYTIDYEGGYAQHSEFDGAAKFVPPGVEHKRVIITRDAYFAAIDDLTIGRKAPTVPHEATVYIAAQQAKQDGVDHLLAGFGADSRLGGFAAFYRDPTIEGFKQQLFRLYVDPQRALKQPASIEWVFEQYIADGRIDVQRFLLEVGTEGSSASEAIELCGIDPVLPYTQLAYAQPFDLTKEPKYLLHNIFTTLYGYPPPFRKFPLWVPYDDWLGGKRITRPEFLPGCVIAKPLFRGEPTGALSFLNRGVRRAWREVHKRLASNRYFPAKQGYLLYSLERYFHLQEEHGWTTPDPRGEA